MTRFTRPTSSAPARLGRGFEALEDRFMPAVDLAVVSAAAPQIVTAGKTVQVQYAVQNVGPSSSQSFTRTDRVVLSTDAVLGNNDDVVVGSVVVTGALPNTATSGTISAAIPANFAGLRNLIVVADAGNQLDDSNPANDFRVVPIAVLAPTAAPDKVPAAADLADKLRQVLNGSVRPTAIGAATPAVTFDAVTNGTLLVGGYTLTDVRVTVTLGTTVSASGTAKLHVPVSGSGVVVIPVTFAATPSSFQVNGTATIADFRYGNEPALVAAQNVVLTVAVSGNPTKPTVVTGGVSFSASQAKVLPEGSPAAVATGPVTATNLKGTLSAAGVLAATAGTVEIAHKDFVRIAASNVAVNVDLARPSAAVMTIATAKVTSPRFPGAAAALSGITVNPTGFQVADTRLTAPLIALPQSSKVETFAMDVKGLKYTRAGGVTLTAMTATAGKVTLFNGRAVVNNVAFAFDQATGVVSGSAAAASGAIGAVSFSANAVALRYAVGATLPSVEVQTAGVKVPLGTGPATLTATGFRLSPDGKFQFDALAGLNLPQLAQGIAASGTFKGDVRVEGTATVIHLTGSATAFGTPVRLDGDLTASTAGLVGVLNVQSPIGGAMPELTALTGMKVTGSAAVAVNATNAAKTLTVAGQSRTLAANTVFARVNGAIKLGDFSLVGSFDLIKDGSAWKVTPTATLSLGGLGSFTVGGSFQILSNGVVGSMSLVRGTGLGLLVDLAGNYRLDVNTTGTAQSGIPANTVRVVASSATLNILNTVRLSATVTIGFRNGLYFGALSNANLSLWDGVATAGVGREIRSDGSFDVSGTSRLVLDSARIGLPGLVMDTNLNVSVSKSAGSAVNFSAAGSGGLKLFGNAVADASVRVTASGFVTLSGFGLSHGFQL